MIKYVGSKRVLVSRIVAAVDALTVRSCLDLFSGTSRVGHGLKGRGYRVHANDPRGRKVGRVSHLRNKELLFIAGEDAEAIDAAYDAVLTPDRQKQLALV